jgi:hypothetical protein
MRQTRFYGLQQAAQAAFATMSRPLQDAGD